MKQSPRQILVRDYNWRMGNMHRGIKWALCLDPDLAGRVQTAIREQMFRDSVRYKDAMKKEK